MTREELWLAAIAGLDGAVPPDYPVWHYEQMLAAIYDAVTGAADPREFPARSWHLDEVLYAVYCAAAGLDDPGCPAPTCRIEQFWKGVYDAANGTTGASVPSPAWRIEEMLSGIFDEADDWKGTLPSAYKRVKGFSLNDNCYWKFTDFKLNGSDTLRFSFSCTAACNVIGAYSGTASGNNYSLYVATSGSGNYLRYKGGAYNSVIDTDTRYDVVITPTGTTGMKTESTWTELEFTSAIDFCVGTTSTSTSSAKMKGSFFGDIIVDGRMHLVPCERVSDSKLGYYDLVEKEFYAPTSGTPTSLGYAD
ncbi:MAG: hypothetical protein IJC51_04570 [Eggerthellaceae bacterium]|nr:hypothetical protein [Eggerthellaceae bacterium]